VAPQWQQPWREVVLAKKPKLLQGSAKEDQKKHQFDEEPPIIDPTSLKPLDLAYGEDLDSEAEAEEEWEDEAFLQAMESMSGLAIELEGKDPEWLPPFKTPIQADPRSTRKGPMS